MRMRARHLSGVRRQQRPLPIVVPINGSRSSQSVPGASYVPCVAGLRTGWRTTNFDAETGHTSFDLESDRSDRAVVVDFTSGCRVAGATAIAPRADGVRTHLRVRSISSRYTGTLYDIFPGGCVTYRFDFKRGPHIALMEDVQASLGLYASGASTATPSRRRNHAPMSGRDESTPLPDAYARSVLGLAALVLTTAMLKRRTVGTRRSDASSRSVNQLPDMLFVPLWLVMQLGTLGAAPAAAAVARASGQTAPRDRPPPGRCRHVGALEGRQACGGAASARRVDPGNAGPRP